MTDATVALRFVCATEGDDVKIAAEIANYLKKSVVIERANGTKHYVIPAETGVFKTKVDGAPDLHEEHQLAEMAEAVASPAEQADRTVGKSPLLAAPYGTPGPVEHPDELHMMLYDAPGG